MGGNLTKALHRTCKSSKSARKMQKIHYNVYVSKSKHTNASCVN